ncbi:MAG: LuxR C-terminal-related transcriptional regulator [Nitrospirales bacterium]
MKVKDWISVIEAGYSLERSDDSWVNEVLDAASPIIRGWWPNCFVFHYTPETFHVEEVAARGPSFIIKKATKSLETLSPKLIDVLLRSGNFVGTASSVFHKLPEQQDVFRRVTRGLIGDNLAFVAQSGSGRGICISMGLFKPTSATALECKRWPLIASHLGAGVRLRAVAKSLTLDTESVEAIFDPGGKLHDARDDAKEPSVRDILREKVRRIDHIRTRAGRSDPDVAMEAWEGLVQGRWSLVDHFDTDQRRFVVAIKNDPMFPDPRGLTTRERQVAEFVGYGQSSKEISYTLGVSHSAVTNSTASAQMKLGLSSRAELAAFFAPSGLRAKLAEVSLAGEELLVGAYPLIDEHHVDLLTEAERSVLAALVAGSTNDDIAQRRNTSDRTVANQVQSIFRKLEVSSRSELAVRLQSVA